MREICEKTLINIDVKYCFVVIRKITITYLVAYRILYFRTIGAEWYFCFKVTVMHYYSENSFFYLRLDFFDTFKSCKAVFGTRGIVQMEGDSLNNYTTKPWL